MSDMDPDGMDSELEGEGDLESPENISDAARLRDQQTRQAGAAPQEKVDPNRSRHIDDSEDRENGDEEDEDMEPRSTPRSASQPPYNRRESDRNRPAPPSDRRR